MRILVALVAVAMAASAVLTITGRTTVDAAAAAGAVPVSMADFQFSPTSYEATAGEPTKLVVHNSDAFLHDINIEAVGVATTAINPGSQKLIEFTATEPGEYLIRCTLHSSSDTPTGEAGLNGDMSALLVVK